MNSISEERRYTPRSDLAVFITLRPIAIPPQPEQHVESVNISRRGMFFNTTAEIPKGTPVEMHFHMPRQISGKPDTEWRCMGRVIRVDRNGLMSGYVGLGVQFDYYELLSA
jgi:hypothetical protein